MRFCVCSTLYSSCDELLEGYSVSSVEYTRGVEGGEVTLPRVMELCISAGEIGCLEAESCRRCSFSWHYISVSHPFILSVHPPFRPSHKEILPTKFKATFDAERTCKIETDDLQNHLACGP
jgi:hypothetical protein